MYEDLLKQPLPENLVAPLRASNELQTARERLEGAVSETRGNTAPAAARPTSPDTLPEAKSVA